MVFAISSRSSTERHGDFSESVVFHSHLRCPVCFWVSGCCGVGFCWFLFGLFFGDT